jgi:hypothetical protein
VNTDELRRFLDQTKYQYSESYPNSFEIDIGVYLFSGDHGLVMVEVEGLFRKSAKTRLDLEAAIKEALLVDRYAKKPSL